MNFKNTLYTKFILFVILFTLALGSFAQNHESVFTQEDRERMIRTEAKLESLEKRIDERFEQADKRFEQIQKQIDETKADIKWYFGLLIGAMFMLFGFILWDRRTFIKPFQLQVDELDVELKKEKVKTVHLTEALRDLAKTDVKLAEILRMHNLL